MLQKPWFKLFIWFMATFFFFLAAAVLISMLRPGPSESDVMRFMMSMMQAMDRSIMGVTMNLENDGALQGVIRFSTAISLPVIILSIIAGFGIRLRNQRRGSDV